MISCIRGANGAGNVCPFVERRAVAALHLDWRYEASEGALRPLTNGPHVARIKRID